MFKKYVIQSILGLSLLSIGASVSANVWIMPFPDYASLPIFYPPAYREPGSEDDEKAPVSDPSLYFTPNTSQRSKNITAYLAQLSKADPAGASEIESQLRAPLFFDT